MSCNAYAAIGADPAKGACSRTMRNKAFPISGCAFEYRRFLRELISLSGPYLISNISIRISIKESAFWVNILIKEIDRSKFLKLDSKRFIRFILKDIITPF